LLQQWQKRPTAPAVYYLFDVQWVKPKLVCEVAFAEWTEDEQLRQTTFLGWRDDKDAKETVL
jgi:bifunctional non-homologous end joining protein LigD